MDVQFPLNFVPGGFGPGGAQFVLNYASATGTAVTGYLPSIAFTPPQTADPPTFNVVATVAGAGTYTATIAYSDGTRSASYTGSFVVASDGTVTGGTIVGGGGGGGTCPRPAAPTIVAAGQLIANVPSILVRVNPA